MDEFVYIFSKSRGVGIKLLADYLTSGNSFIIKCDRRYANLGYSMTELEDIFPVIKYIIDLPHEKQVSFANYAALQAGASAYSIEIATNDSDDPIDSFNLYIRNSGDYQKIIDALSCIKYPYRLLSLAININPNGIDAEDLQRTISDHMWRNESA